MGVSLLEDGFSVYSAHFLSCIACTIANQYRDIRTSQRIYHLVKKCQQNFKHPLFDLISRTIGLTHVFFYEPLSWLIDDLQDVFREANRMGVYSWGAYAIMNSVWMSWVGARTLSHIIQVTNYALQSITKKVDRRINRDLLFYKYMAELLEGGEADLTQPDILQHYIACRHPSIVSSLRGVKNIDRNSWYCSVWGRLYVGLIFINRPNGPSFCKKLVRKLTHYFQPELINTTHVTFLTAIVNVRYLKMAISNDKCSEYLKESTISQLNKAIQQYQTMVTFNPQEWKHKLFFLQSLLLETKYMIRENVSIEQVVNMYNITLNAMESYEPIPYLDLGLASEFLNDFLQGEVDSKVFSELTEGIKYTPEEAFYLWGSKLKVQHLQQTVSLPINDTLRTQDLIFSLSSLNRDVNTKEELLFSIMKILLHNTGYSKGVFLIDKEWYETTYEREKYSFLSGSETDNVGERIPKYLVSGVRAQKIPITMGPSRSSPDREIYLSDPYFKGNKSVSVICMPLCKNSENILYLETSFSPHFPSLDSLEVVSHQIMLIIEAWETYNVLHMQVIETGKAKKYKEKQSRFIDALCHEMRNPLNGLVGSLQVLQLFKQSSWEFSQLIDVKFLMFLMLAIFSGAHLHSVIAAICLAIFINLVSFVRVRWKMKSEQNGASWDETLGDIKECIEHQKAILDDSLQVQKLDSPDVKLDLSPLSLGDLIHSVLAMFLVTIHKKGLDLDYKHKGSTDKVMVDTLKLKNVVINLVSNAVKFTEVGQIKIRTKTCIEKDDHATLTIKVKDTGPGFSDKDKKMFSYFEQLDMKRRDYGGSGVGLAISKKMVELMGGSITGESEFGKGSLFTVKIPTVLSKEDSAPAINENELVTNNFNDSDLGNILVVDDNTLNRKALSIYFAKQVDREVHL
eukprot:TRINITY_DN3205_c0_g1_i1.p1 TRINITY_DN3205_c0_g1~~TRINITY_DN3205_c0_g1_i1.p1  ORF type:complete len:1014 (+),score=107.20 TRINITY_DN3205_c0_g1_i1:318-3044(+)